MSEEEKTAHRQRQIEAENKIRFYEWYDKLPPLHRDFMNDYGYEKWLELRDMMNGSGYQLDLKLNSWRSHHPPVTRVVE